MARKKMHFEISERKILLRFFDAAFLMTGLYLLHFIFDNSYYILDLAYFYRPILLITYIFIFGVIFEMYNLQVSSNQVQIVRSVVLTATASVILYLFTPILSPELPKKRLVILVFYFTILIILLVWRFFYAIFLASHRFSQSVVLICGKDQVEGLVSGLENVDPHYNIIGFVNSDSVTEQSNEFNYVKEIKKQDLEDFVMHHNVSEIVIAAQKTDGITPDLYQQLLHLLESGNIIKEYTHVYESKTQRIPVHYIERDFYRFFPFSRSNSNKLYLILIRLIEFSLSIIGLLFCVLFIPVIFIGNLIANKGSLFYTQERVGKNGVVFKIYKFRTMIENTDVNGPFAQLNDKRITPFGKFMRKSRLDELPQFFNILIGDMGVIGPRPERPYFVAEIAKIMPFYETRHVIKPGLTGWAQVNYSYGESIDESLIKLQYDLYYIKHRSVFLDLSITFKTITTVLFYRGQ
ncbi:exopolysaccharide biosynthesis polyprenyl glycosylphosphotransferase [Flavobacterium resistens]|uniref:Exopolysaccharide biosynthesis polyprenyl glycosylphosphotransferase n=1 Tax=Flavobacterium resistens TaxID=443612 RepID=A0A521EQQ2_9FLAO|nr:exopolysaccharide biosynthesis polyprenyl glycosylphosphotransferase [Flavobacterium resistens]MRX67882.1 exopolysaccharide biosynthesis polyprenyl glycosylphosphotransferase [Flavobacterium resistens]SMO86225.1 exopolysaccharide biosynthesis polyprenyl glycosylphosphotransferase [Flavobacterium resistens]